MFKRMRRETKLAGETETISLLEQGVYGTLATMGVNGYPSSIPLNYAYKNNSIYFHSAKEGHKIDNMNYCDKVAFSVVTMCRVVPEEFDTKYDSVVVYGRAVEITDPKEKQEGLMLLIQKYSGDFLEKGRQYVEKAFEKTAVYKIQIEYVTGKIGR